MVAADAHTVPANRTPLSSYHGFFPLEIDILTGTEIPREWDAVEDVTHFTVIHRDHIKQDDQNCKEDQGKDQTHADKNYLLTTVIWAKGDIWHEGIGQKETKYETKEVGIIVYPREKTEEQ